MTVILTDLERLRADPAATAVPPEWQAGLARLQMMECPVLVPARRWRQLHRAAQDFLRDWAAQAAVLGWDVYGLFGCHPEAPVERLDHAGLLWLLGEGEQVIALAADTATIRTPTGARQTYRRRPSQPGQVLAWKLDVESDKRR